MSVSVPVLIFETDPKDSGELDNALTRAGIGHVSRLVRLRNEHEPPPAEYFQTALDTYHPRMLITSWCEIGTIVRFAEREMAKPRPVEKWVISIYSTQTLEDHRAISWADEVYKKPISASYLVEKVERCLQRIQGNFQLV